MRVNELVCKTECLAAAELFGTQMALGLKALGATWECLPSQRFPLLVVGRAHCCEACYELRPASSDY